MIQLVYVMRGYAYLS